MEKFNLLDNIKARAAYEKRLAVFLSYLMNCTEEQRARAASLYGKQQNVGMVFEATLNPDGRQNAQAKGEQSHGDILIEVNGKREACELKALSPKTSASDAENGTTAPWTLLFFYDNNGYCARLGHTCDVRIGLKGGKRVIKYQDNIENFGKPIDIHKARTYALAY